MKILILGHNGMLGNMVEKYFTKKPFQVEKTEHRWPSDKFKQIIENFDGDYIINCIGAIHQRTSRFEINWELPIYLDFYANCKIIHPGTDCEMDNDAYGTSKRIARNFLVNDSSKTKSLKTSIVGPELKTKSSLMEWFLSNEDGSTVKGFSKYFWNGNTTLTWAKIAEELMLNWESFSKETIIASPEISKMEILQSLNEVFERNILIEENSDVQYNKCLCGDIQTLHIKEQLEELKNFYY